MTAFVWTMLVYWMLRLGWVFFSPLKKGEEGDRIIGFVLALAVVIWCVVLLTGCGDGGETANVCTKDCGPKEPPQVDLRKP